MRYLVRKGVIKLLVIMKAKHNKCINAERKKRARLCWRYVSELSWYYQSDTLDI